MPRQLCKLCWGNIFFCWQKSRCLKYMLGQKQLYIVPIWCQQYFILVTTSKTNFFLITLNVKTLRKITDSIIDIILNIITFCWEIIEKIMKNNVHYVQHFQNVGTIKCPIVPTWSKWCNIVPISITFFVRFLVCEIWSILYFFLRDLAEIWRKKIFGRGASPRTPHRRLRPQTPDALN